MDHANLFSSNALFSCFYLRIFFTSREKNVLGRIQKEIMDFKKASWPNFCNSFFYAQNRVGRARRPTN